MTIKTTTKKKTTTNKINKLTKNFYLNNKKNI